MVDLFGLLEATAEVYVMLLLMEFVDNGKVHLAAESTSG